MTTLWRRHRLQGVAAAACTPPLPCHLQRRHPTDCLPGCCHDPAARRRPCRRCCPCPWHYLPRWLHHGPLGTHPGSRHAGRGQRHRWPCLRPRRRCCPATRRLPQRAALRPGRGTHRTTPHHHRRPPPCRHPHARRRPCTAPAGRRRRGTAGLGTPAARQPPQPQTKVRRHCHQTRPPGRHQRRHHHQQQQRQHGRPCPRHESPRWRSDGRRPSCPGPRPDPNRRQPRGEHVWWGAAWAAPPRRLRSRGAAVHSA
jgi:hypothetical protein